MFNVDIDTGGTMTDGLISGGAEPFSVKVETTPHDVTVAFLEVFRAAAEKLQISDLSKFLNQVDLIRWSSTITSNVLAERKGSKLGLLVTSGHEKDLYGAEGEADIVFESIIQPQNVEGIPENATDGEVLLALRSLFESGIRRVNVSLGSSFPDNRRELEIVKLISNQYPDHFLGSIPALSASEILMVPDSMTRTSYSLINAYVHSALATTAYRAEDTLRQDHGWRGNVLIGHINGGVARIGKTTAVDTIESGPLFGTYACARRAGQAKDDRVLAIDVGGTTAKASAVERGEVIERDGGHLFGIPLQTRLPLLRSIALGGGSVAQIKDGELVLGPESMGAAPGPASYGLGGRAATLTDAFVVLGLIKPEGFLNGRRTLDVDAARKAVERNVAIKLELSVDEAAMRIATTAFKAMAGLCRDTAAENGWDAGETTLYAYGGNGPLFATAVGDLLGCKKVQIFKYGNVLSAYGSATSDIVHVYERPVDGELRDVMDSLVARAARDLEGEGFDSASMKLSWEATDAANNAATAQGAAGDAVGPLQSGLQQPIAFLRLHATHELPPFAESERSATSAALRPTGHRESPIKPDGGLPAYQWDDLFGRALDGPAIVDGGSFTWYISPGWNLSVDAYGDAVAVRKETK